MVKKINKKYVKAKKDFFIDFLNIVEEKLEAIKYDKLIKILKETNIVCFEPVISLYDIITYLKNNETIPIFITGLSAYKILHEQPIENLNVFVLEPFEYFVKKIKEIPGFQKKNYLLYNFAFNPKNSYFRIGHKRGANIKGYCIPKLEKCNVGQEIDSLIIDLFESNAMIYDLFGGRATTAVYNKTWNSSFKNCKCINYCNCDCCNGDDWIKNNPDALEKMLLFKLNGIGVSEKIEQLIYKNVIKNYDKEFWKFSWSDIKVESCIHILNIIREDCNRLGLECDNILLCLIKIGLFVPLVKKNQNNLSFKNISKDFIKKTLKQKNNNNEPWNTTCPVLSADNNTNSNYIKKYTVGNKGENSKNSVYNERKNKFFSQCPFKIHRTTLTKEQIKRINERLNESISDCFNPPLSFKNIIRHLKRNNTVPIFIHGGGIRDLLLDKPIKDIDLIICDNIKSVRIRLHSLPGLIKNMFSKCFRWNIKTFPYFKIGIDEKNQLEGVCMDIFDPCQSDSRMNSLLLEISNSWTVHDTFRGKGISDTYNESWISPIIDCKCVNDNSWQRLLPRLMKYKLAGYNVPKNTTNYIYSYSISNHSKVVWNMMWKILDEKNYINIFELIYNDCKYINESMYVDLIICFLLYGVLQPFDVRNTKCLLLKL